MFSHTYKGKKVLITGHTGFKGAWLCIWLNILGADLYGISKDIPSNPSLFDVLSMENLLSHKLGDLRDLSRLSALIHKLKPDFIFHLAAQTLVGISYEDPIETFSSNVMGSCNLLEALRISNHPCTLIIVSSDKAYENVAWTWGYRENDPLGGKDPYSASKSAMELIVRSYYHSFFSQPQSQLRIGIVRAGNVIGGGDWAIDRLVPDCVRAWSKGESVLLRHPQATRPWQHVLEPLSGYLQLGAMLSTDSSLNGEAFNFGPFTEQNYSVLELLQAMAMYWDAPKDQEFFQLQQQTSYQEAELLKVNCDKALHRLGWRPCWNFQQTAELTSQWYQHYYQQGREGLWELTLSQISQYISQAKLAAIS